MQYLFMFFFFKQKTSYEMRISDWSSDVCSSDLFRQFIIHWVREAKRQVQHCAFCLRLVTNTDQLELALEALAYALDHVVYQRTSGTSHCASLLIAQIGRAACRERVCQSV